MRNWTNGSDRISVEHGKIWLYQSCLENGSYEWVDAWEKGGRKILFKYVQLRKWEEALIFFANCIPAIFKMKAIPNCDFIVNLPIKGMPKGDLPKEIAWVSYLDSKLDECCDGGCGVCDGSTLEEIKWLPSYYEEKENYVPHPVKEYDLPPPEKPRGVEDIHFASLAEVLSSRELIRVLLLLAAYGNGHGKLESVYNFVNIELSNKIVDLGLEMNDLECYMSECERQSQCSSQYVSEELIRQKSAIFFRNLLRKVSVEQESAAIEVSYIMDGDGKSKKKAMFFEVPSGGSRGMNSLRLISTLAIKDWISICGFCGNPIDHSPRSGGKPEYCSRTCRQYASLRNRAKSLHEEGNTIRDVRRILKTKNKMIVESGIESKTDEDFLENLNRERKEVHSVAKS